MTPLLTIDRFGSDGNNGVKSTTKRLKRSRNYCILRFGGIKYTIFCVVVVEAAGRDPVTRTKKCRLTSVGLHFLFCVVGLKQCHDTSPAPKVRRVGQGGPEASVAELWGSRLWPQVQVLSLRPKIGIRKSPDFSLFISQNLLKSRIFATNKTGLFFPASRVEQAHFSHLTTCLTTWGEFRSSLTKYYVQKHRKMLNCSTIYDIINLNPTM